jgi:hypothetical protein
MWVGWSQAAKTAVGGFVMVPLRQRYADRIHGVLSCFDRVVITGTLPDICHGAAMAAYLTVRDIRLFDYPGWANGLREHLREHVERLAKDNGLEIQFLRRSKLVRKEELIRNIIAERGSHPGLVAILSTMERCTAFKPWFDKQRQQAKLLPTDGKCLHYYFYFIDAALGLCYLRVPTWAPFRLQLYFNAHNALAAEPGRHRFRHAR